MVKKILLNGHKIFLREQNNILSAAALITAASFISAIFGLLRNRLLLGHFFETTQLREQLDAYWVAFRLPELVFQLLVIGALSAAFIPVFAAYKRKSQEEAFHLTNSMMNLVLLVFIALSVVIFIFAEQFNGAITSDNFSPEQVRLAAHLTRIMLLAQLFFAGSNFLTGMIQAHQRFLIPALSPLAYNLGIILGIMFLSPIFGIYGPAIGVVLGALLHLLMQIPVAYRLGFRYRPIIDFKHPGVAEIIRLMPPRALTISVNQLETFVSVYFATALSAGSLTIMNLAQQLMTAPIRVFSVPIGQAALPFLSEEAAKGDLDRFKKTLIQSVHQVLFLAFPAGVLLLILRIPLVRLAYGTQDFPWQATLLTGKVVALLSLSLFAQSATHVLVRGFYALHNTKIPLIISLVSVALSVSLSYAGVFVFSWGILGLASAMSISAVLHFVLLFLFLHKEIGGFGFESLVISPLKIAFASAIMGLFLWGPMRLLDQFVFDTTRTLPLIGLTLVASLIGGFVYFLLAYILELPEFAAYITLIRKIGNWRQVLTASEEVMETPSQTQEINPL